MAVIVGIVGLFVLIVPRPNSVQQPRVDLGQAVAGAREQVTFDPVVPQGLPPGWQPVSANALRNTDGVFTWQISYTTPDDTFAAVRQAGNPTPAWENRQVTDGRENGTVSIAGHDWVVRSRTDRKITSWVQRAPNLTTIVTGTASEADLRTLATSLPTTIYTP